MRVFDYVRDSVMNHCEDLAAVPASKGSPSTVHVRVGVRHILHVRHSTGGVMHSRHRLIYVSFGFVVFTNSLV